MIANLEEECLFEEKEEKGKSQIKTMKAVREAAWDDRQPLRKSKGRNNRITCLVDNSKSVRKGGGSITK